MSEEQFRYILSNSMKLFFEKGKINSEIPFWDPPKSALLSAINLVQSPSKLGKFLFPKGKKGTHCIFVNDILVSGGLLKVTGKHLSAFLGKSIPMPIKPLFFFPFPFSFFLKARAYGLRRLKWMFVLLIWLMANF